MLPVLVLLCAYINLAQAVLADPYVKPTARYINHEYLINGWTPKPTQAPRVRTPFGAIANKDLFPRAIVSTCGYLNGDPNDPYTCDSGEECAFIYSVDPQYWQCCPLASGSAVNWASCTNYVDCVDYRTSSEPNTGSAPYTAGQTIYCPSANPICFTAVLAQPEAGSTYLSFGCWTETYTATIYQNPTSQSSVSDPSSTTQSSSPGPTAPSSTSSEPPTEPPTSSTSSPSTTSTMQFSIPQGGPPSQTQSNPNNGAQSKGSGTGTPSPTHPGKKTNVGAIAGGVVGGVVVLGAIGVGIGYMVYRKRQQRVEPMREISPGYYAPSPSMNY